MTLEFLLRHSVGAAGTSSAATALEIAGRALTAMANSGMYDQVAGGFARYAVDAAWVVPHFEKMLTDNALLARVYLHWWRATGNPTGARIAHETCDWMLAALGTDEGGLACSLDADTEGVEGSTYVWTPAQLRQVLDGDVDVVGATRLGRRAARGHRRRHLRARQLDPAAHPGRLGRPRRRPSGWQRAARAVYA